MRRFVSTLFRAARVIGVLAVVRAVLLDRAPRRELHGSEPVIGSLDTWPAVPRKPQTQPEPEGTTQPQPKTEPQEQS